MTPRKFTYTIEITVNAESVSHDDARKYIDTNMKVDADGDTMVMTKEGMTNFGFTVLTDTLAGTIVNLAKCAARDNGIKESDVIAHAINEIQQRFIANDKKPPVSSMVKKTDQP